MVAKLDERIKAVRETLEPRPSHRAIAKILGVSGPTYSRYESGERDPPAGFLVALLELNPKIDPGWLLMGKGEMLSVVGRLPDEFNTELELMLKEASFLETQTPEYGKDVVWAKAMQRLLERTWQIHERLNLGNQTRFVGAILWMAIKALTYYRAIPRSAFASSKVAGAGTEATELESKGKRARQKKARTTEKERKR